MELGRQNVCCLRKAVDQLFMEVSGCHPFTEAVKRIACPMSRFGLLFNFRKKRLGFGTNVRADFAMGVSTLPKVTLPKVKVLTK